MKLSSITNYLTDKTCLPIDKESLGRSLNSLFSNENCTTHSFPFRKISPPS